MHNELKAFKPIFIIINTIGKANLDFALVDPIVNVCVCVAVVGCVCTLCER